PAQLIEPTLENVSRVRSTSEFTSVRESLLDATLRTLEGYNSNTSPLLLRPQLEDLANRWYYLEKAEDRLGGMNPVAITTLKPRIEALERSLQNDHTLSSEVSRAFSAYGLSDCSSVVAMLKGMAGLNNSTPGNS
ncbi:MAG: hypothetical protein AAGH89_05600, partial [Verrucomicrobiota bacterium]